MSDDNKLARVAKAELATNQPYKPLVAGTVAGATSVLTLLVAALWVPLAVAGLVAGAAVLYRAFGWRLSVWFAGAGLTSLLLDAILWKIVVVPVVIVVAFLLAGKLQK